MAKLAVEFEHMEGPVEIPVKKVNRHVTVALNHLNTRRDALLANRAKLNKEIEELDAAILALG